VYPVHSPETWKLFTQEKAAVQGHIHPVTAKDGRDNEVKRKREKGKWKM
jgi:hypothetical protein